MSSVLWFYVSFRGSLAELIVLKSFNGRDLVHSEFVFH